MPRQIQQAEVGDFVVRFRQRLAGEDLKTEYAVQTYENGAVVWHIHDAQGFCDDLYFAERKFERVVQLLRELQGI